MTGYMNRPRLNYVVFALCVAIVPWRTAETQPPKTRSPNIIIILADDMGYGDLGCYGHPKHQTPQIDKLAAEGTRFTHFNTPMPFCAPTRASLLTGRYPSRCGMIANPTPDGALPANLLALPHREVTLAQLLRQAGYITALIGKWHLGHARPEFLPTHRGFDEYFGIPYSNDMRPVRLLDGEKVVEEPAVQATLTKRYTERAISFIGNAKDRPFFLLLAHAMPHKPLACSVHFYNKSGFGLYGDVVAEMDASVGSLMAKLKQMRLDENTLVIFTSDNGPWHGGSSGGLRGMKSTTWEGGTRVPCILRWPGRIPAGATSDAQAVTMDLFATSLAAAGVSKPVDRTIDGEDLTPMLLGRQKSVHDVVFVQQGPQLAAIRDARWKLHVLPSRERRPPASNKPWRDPRGPDGVTILAPDEQYPPTAYPGVLTGDPARAMSLFDLVDDPAEQRDVSSSHPEIVANLKFKYDQMVKELGGSPPVRP